MYMHLFIYPYVYSSINQSIYVNIYISINLFINYISLFIYLFSIYLFSKIDPDDLARRTAFLRAQRDKLLAMKKMEREKMLAEAEASTAKVMG